MWGEGIPTERTRRLGTLPSPTLPFQSCSGRRSPEHRGISPDAASSRTGRDINREGELPVARAEGEAGASRQPAAVRGEAAVRSCTPRSQPTYLAA